MNKVNKSLLVCSVMFSVMVSGYVPQVNRSLRPMLKPENLRIVPAVKDGVFKDGKVRLSLNFNDEGIFYQREEREQLIPVVYYLKNEYPSIDFSTLKMTSINLNAKTLGDFAYTRFYSSEGLMLAESFIPQVQDPNEVFGDFINSTLSDQQIDDLLYVGISGIQNINNITATFELGTPNFSLNLNKMPNSGNYVGEIEGYKKRGFNQSVFDDVMTEVRKMTSMGHDTPLISWNGNDPYSNGQNNDFYNNDTDYYNPTPSVVPYREREDLDYNRQLSQTIERVSLFGGTLVLSLNQGSASLTGYQIQRSNGKVNYTEMGTYITPYNQLRVKLRKGDSDGVITFFFSSISKGATTFLMRER